MHASISFLYIFASLALPFLVLGRKSYPSRLGPVFLIYLFAPLPVVFSTSPHAWPTNNNLFEHDYLMLHYNNNYDFFCSVMILKCWRVGINTYILQIFPEATVLCNLMWSAGVRNKSGPENRAAGHHCYFVSFFWFEMWCFDGTTVGTSLTDLPGGTSDG